VSLPLRLGNQDFYIPFLSNDDPQYVSPWVHLLAVTPVTAARTARNMVALIVDGLNKGLKR
jgi:hypothetical protein